MTRIALLGAAGRMGHTLAARIQERDDCELVAGVDTHGGEGLPFPLFGAVDEMLETIRPDVLVDFSNPDAVRSALPVCAEHALPVVVCTTGLGEDVMALLHTAAQSTAVFHSANMSLGINLLAELARRAAEVLPGFDIEIVEKHHHNKLDAPSGTALLLADEINDEMGGRYHYTYDRHARREKRSPDEIGLHAVRGGSIVGEHEVLFAGPDEVVTLSHGAYSREVFANGAVRAAKFIHGKPAGLYTMKQLLEDTTCTE